MHKPEPEIQLSTTNYKPVPDRKASSERESIPDLQSVISGILSNIVQNPDVQIVTQQQIGLITAHIDRLEARILLSDQTNVNLRQEILQLREEILQLREENTKLLTQINELEIMNKNQYEITEKLEKRLKEIEKGLEIDHNNRLLGELARQVEKALCLKILNNPRIYSLPIMFKQLKQDPNLANAKANWNICKQNIGWDNFLYQTLTALKDSRAKDNHPNTTYQGKPITSSVLKAIIKNSIQNKDDQNDAYKLVSILEMENGKENLFVFRV